MRIALYSDNFHPELSGITDTIIITGEELQKRGHEVMFVAPHYARRDYEPLKRLDKDGRVLPNPRDELPTVRLPSLPFPSSPTGQSRLALPFGYSLPAMLRFEPDIIHTQSPYGTGLEALLVSRLLGVPMVGTNHSPIQDYLHFTLFRGKWFEKFARYFDAWYYNRCSFVTTPYRGLIRYMRQVGFKRDAEALANPIRLDMYHVPSHSERTARKEEKCIPGPAIFYVGRLAPEKHVDVVIRAIPLLIKKFPDLTFLVAGQGSAREDLEHLSETLGVRSHVRFLGFVTPEELPAWYEASEVFVIMSTADTQSLALMQGLAAGQPAVTADCRAFPDYVPKEAGYLVAPGDHARLAERIDELLSDDVLRERMGNAAAAFVQQFSPAAIADEWEKIYRRAARSSS